MSNRSLFAAFAATLLVSSFVPLQADTDVPAAGTEAPVAETTASDEAAATPAASEPVVAVEEEKPAPVVEAPKAAKKSKFRIEKADSFLAPADWEFDGFVAGGKDQEVKSMYHLNDVIYLHIGTEQGLTSGDRVQIFKRGKRVRDPHTGKLAGYELRRIASGLVTDRVGDKTCSVRIMSGNEGVEIGDLVRRD